MCAELPSKLHREESGTDLPSESFSECSLRVLLHFSPPHDIKKWRDTLSSFSGLFSKTWFTLYSFCVFWGGKNRWTKFFSWGPYVSCSVFIVSRWKIFVVMVEFHIFLYSWRQSHGLSLDTRPWTMQGHLYVRIFFHVACTLTPSISLFLWSVFSCLVVPQSLFVLISEALNNSQGSCPRGKGPQTCLDH